MQETSNYREKLGCLDNLRGERKQKAGEANLRPAEQSSVSSPACFSPAGAVVSFPPPLFWGSVRSGIISRTVWGGHVRKACLACLVWAPKMTLERKDFKKSRLTGTRKMTLRKAMKSPVEVSKKWIRFQSLCLVEVGLELPTGVQVQSSFVARGAGERSEAKSQQTGSLRHPIPPPNQGPQ